MHMPMPSSYLIFIINLGWAVSHLHLVCRGRAIEFVSLAVTIASFSAVMDGRKASDDAIGFPEGVDKVQRKSRRKLLRTRARDAHLPQGLRRKLRIVEANIVLDTGTIELGGGVFENREPLGSLEPDAHIISDHIGGFDALRKLA